MTVMEKKGWKWYGFGYISSPQMHYFINTENWQCRQSPLCSRMLHSFGLLRDNSSENNLALCNQNGVVLYEQKHWPWFKEAQMQTVPGSAESSYGSKPKHTISLNATWDRSLVSSVKPQGHLWSIPLKRELLTVNFGDLN